MTWYESERAPAVAGRRRTVALFVVMLAMFMDLLDATIVNLALPSIHRGLGGPYSAVQWVCAGYALAFGAALITGGRLGDLYGRKRLFMVGAAGFTVASAACGLAESTDTLVAARVVQGVFAALMVPQVLSVVQTLYAPRERGRAMSCFGVLAALANVGGPVLGAVLTSGDLAGLGWRAVFLVNVPVGAIALALAACCLPESTAPGAERLDPVGSLLSTAALLALLHPLIQGRSSLLLAAAPGLAVLFVLQQRGRARRTGSSLVRLGLFRCASFTGGLLVALLFTGAVSGFFLILALHLQDGLGYSVLRSGLTALPWGLTLPVFAAVGARVLVPRLGRATLQLGIALDIAAMLAVAAAGGHTDTPALPVALAVGGIGMGLIVVPLLDFTLAEVPAADAGSASGLYNTVQQIGGALGIGAIGTTYLGGHPAGAAALAHSLWLPVATFTAALAATFLLPRRPAGHAPEPTAARFADPGVPPGRDAPWDRRYAGAPKSWVHQGPPEP